MKQMKLEVKILIVLFVIFPLIYLVHNAVESFSGKQDGVTPLPDLHCSLVKQYMDGDTLVVQIQNSGSSSWSEEQLIRCTIFLDGEDSGLRVTLKPDQTIAPGKNAFFYFYDVKAVLNETAEIVMLQETVEYFPERFPVEMPPLSDLHCTLVEQHMDGDTLVVTLRNSGESVWQEKDWVRCTIFLNGEDSGLRAKLQPEQLVAPGENAEFCFPDVKPLLEETAEIVMLQETVAYFSEKIPVAVQ